MTARDPYADLGAVYDEEISVDRIRVFPKRRTTTDGVWSDDHSLPGGFHIDGDRRYQER